MLAEAARELLEDRDALTRALLGGATEPDAEPPLGGPPPGLFPQTFGTAAIRPGIGHARMFRPGQGEPTPFAPEQSER